MRVVTAILVAAVVILLSASVPAEAKGPSRALIEGPGISSPITLPGPNETTIGPELAALIKDSGVFVELWCQTCDERLRHQPTEELGSKYTVTYTMTVTINNRTRSNPVVQYIFPNAAPDPVTYVPPGQRFWGTQRTVGGWFIARPRLRHLLVGLGVPLDASTRPTRASVANEGRTWVWPVVLAIAAILILAGLALITRRMHSGATGNIAS